MRDGRVNDIARETAHVFAPRDRARTGAIRNVAIIRKAHKTARQGVSLDVNVHQVHISDGGAFRAAEKSDLVLRGPVDGQARDGVSRAIEGTFEIIARGPHGRKAQTAVPATGLAGVNVVGKLVAAREVILHVLQIVDIVDHRLRRGRQHERQACDRQTAPLKFPGNHFAPFLKFQRIGCTLARKA